MTTEILNGHDVKRMFDAALAGLAKRHKEIDALNVFPVPDGDTGTNMYLTFASAVEEAARAGNPSSVGLVVEAAARGSLMGARGNSGVILSQLLRGFAQELKNSEQMNNITFAQALEEGVKVAFKAIMKPVEGTILTVAREAAKTALKTANRGSNMAGLLKNTCDVAEETLRNTPKMLPALANAGVVDAGGMGWLVILRGFQTAVSGEGAEEIHNSVDIVINQDREIVEAFNIQYPYCTELLVNTTDGIGDLRSSLEQLGDSLMIAESGSLTRVHVHSAHPGQVIESCLRYGSLKDVKVTNMIDQAAQAAKPASAVVVTPAARDGKTFGIVSVAMGEGIKSVMESLGADVVVTGGQTMNPSTQEMLAAVSQLGTDAVIVLPNNKNIIMSANQLVDLSDKKIVVIPSQSIPQGLAALLAIIPGSDLEKTAKLMREACGRVKTGEVTYAVRSTKVNDRTIEKGEILGLCDDEIITAGTEIGVVVTELLQKMSTPDSEVCSLYFGNGVSSEEADELLEQLSAQFPELEYELISGGQPLYYYIISLE
ncbi:MAG: DAK2 domain-containing protein [Thermincola sp.]|nr:DAK2 domain-containing protein [Thermincola sp.]MDT3701559.1 DAK2 domain-containing protein [Thermincola sp.]